VGRGERLARRLHREPQHACQFETEQDAEDDADRLRDELEQSSAVSAKPSIASCAAPTTVSPASMRTIPDATMTDGRMVAACSTRPRERVRAATIVRTRPPAIWLKK
jgi:hypothetical protein